HSEKRVVSSAAGGNRGSGEALREGYGKTGAGDERPEKRFAGRPGSVVRADRRDLFFKFRNSHHARRTLGTSPAADAAGDSGPLGTVACAGRAETGSGTRPRKE